MKDASIYESLYNYSDARKARGELIAYLKAETQHMIPSSEDTYASAYILAGLMATDYVRTLSDEDPIIDILTIAGELEISPPNSEELAADLVQKVQSL